MQIRSLIVSLCVGSTLYGVQIVNLAGDMNYPPYSYIENGKPKGIYVDIIKEAFKNIPKYDIKLKMMAYKRAIAMTKKGKIVGFFPPYYSKSRTKWTEFSTPILAESTVVFAKASTLKNKKKYPEDFYGYTACLNRGFDKTLLGGEEFANAIKNKKIKLIEANNNNDCLTRVKRDIADFYINDQIIDISKFKNIERGMKAKSNFGHIGFTLKDSNYPFMKDLQEKFNTQVNKMKQTGIIDKIVEKYKN